jgi:hypothetical protein
MTSSRTRLPSSISPGHSPPSKSACCSSCPALPGAEPCVDVRKDVGEASVRGGHRPAGRARCTPMPFAARTAGSLASHQHRQRVHSAAEVDRARGHQYAKTRADRYHRVVRAAKNTSRKTERSTGPLMRMRTSPNSTSTTQASFTTGVAGASPDTTIGTNAGPPRTLLSAFFVPSAAWRRQRNKRLGLMS